MIKRLGKDTRKGENRNPSGKRYYYFTKSGKRTTPKKYYAVRKALKTKEEKKKLRGSGIVRVKESKAFLKLQYRKQLKGKDIKPYKETKRVNKNYYIDSGISRRKTEYEIHKRLVPLSDVEKIIREYAFDYAEGFHFNATMQVVTGEFVVKDEILVKGQISPVIVLRNFQFKRRGKKDIKLKSEKEIRKQFEKEFETFEFELEEFEEEYLNQTELQI